MSDKITKVREEIIKLINTNQPDPDLSKKLKKMGKKLTRLLELHDHSIPHVGGNIIDSDYRGEISIFLQNNDKLEKSFKKGDKIGQIVVCKLGDNSIDIVNELSDTIRGKKGVGSTGI